MAIFNFECLLPRHLRLLLFLLLLRHLRHPRLLLFLLLLRHLRLQRFRLRRLLFLLLLRRLRRLLLRQYNHLHRDLYQELVVMVKYHPPK